MPLASPDLEPQPATALSEKEAAIARKVVAQFAHQLEQQRRSYNKRSRGQTRSGRGDRIAQEVDRLLLSTQATNPDSLFR